MTTVPMPQSPARILIVEDEQLVAIDLQSQLEHLGYQVVAAVACGEEAIARATELRPDLVLMDVRIEGPIDGIETAREIGRIRWVPIVFLTAYSDVETLRRAKMALPYGYLVKPFDQCDLEAAIQVALQKGAADRQLRESHDDLRAILDAQRHGTVMLDAAGRITFASRAARAMFDADGCEAGGTMREMLALSAEQAVAVENMCGRALRDRHKVPLVLHGDSPRPRHLEIEVADDPRGAGGRILFVYDVSPLVDLRRQLDDQAAFQNILGKSKPMQQVFQLIRDVARVHSTVLIEGETGTGKELVARAIHHSSPRRDGPFLALNCAGLGEDLAASQLFGHRRGSFTGAVDDQQGVFEAAAGGTLFLDEIGELPIRVQTTLLRVLEENCVLRIGETRPRPVDVRVLAATNRDLAREVAENRFRQDLFYRIRVARIRLPALRERREDLPLLVRAFLADLRAVTGKAVAAISDEAMAAVMDHGWPGNVRELRNALEFAMIRARGSLLGLEDLPPELLELNAATDPDQLAADEAGRIQSALRRARGNRTRAAAILGISRATLYRKLRELGIDEA